MVDPIAFTKQYSVEHGEGARAVTAVGEPAIHPTGVLYQGPWQNEADGFSEHTRRCARALFDAGVPLHLRSFRFQQAKRNPWDERDLVTEFAKLTDGTIGTYRAMVHQVVPSPGLLHEITHHPHLSVEVLERLHRRRVIYSVWERDNLMPAEVAALGKVGQVWTACQANAAMLRAAGLADVRVVPYPAHPCDPHLALEGRRRLTGPVRFYHVGKWEPRKEQRNIIGAFLIAFRHGEAVLYLKTSPFGPKAEPYPSSPGEAILSWLEDERVEANGWHRGNVGGGINIIEQILPSKRLLSLHATCDVYVSLSRGEGWDIPAFEAKLSGNLLVHTASGGPQDFAGEHDIEVPRRGSVPCHPWYGWDGCTYLDYNIEDAALALRQARRLVLDGKRERGMDVSKFMHDHVGQLMKQNLQELLAAAGEP